MALFATAEVNAQQGFGTSTPAPSSVIDAVATDKGVLLPRIALTSTTVAAPVTAPANALTVFNTATAGDVTPGYYYWSTTDTKWVRLLTSEATDWHITGNAGTTPITTVPTAVGTTNYVGTSDAQNFVVGVNGISRGIFTQQGSFIGGAGTMDLGALPEHAIGTGITPTGSFIWGGGHRLAIATDGTPTGNANYATVLGNRNTVQSSNGFTTGTQNTIGTSSVSSMVSGNQNNLGNYFQTSIVTGQNNTMTHSQNGGRGNIVYGTLNNISGEIAPYGSIVGGYGNTVTGPASSSFLTGVAVFGQGNTISSTMNHVTVVGKYNTPVDNSLFIVGNGTGAAAQNNALIVLSDGDVVVGANSIPNFTSGASTINPKFHVAGDVSTTGAFYTATGVYADYVFEDYFDGSSKIKENYSFKTLAEVEKFINQNRHLPGITKIDNLAKNENGDYIINTTELSVQLLEKVEELYLHTIEQQNLIEKQQTEIQDMKSRLERLESLLLDKK